MLFKHAYEMGADAALEKFANRLKMHLRSTGQLPQAPRGPLKAQGDQGALRSQNQDAMAQAMNRPQMQAPAGAPQGAAWNPAAGNKMRDPTHYQPGAPGLGPRGAPAKPTPLGQPMQPVPHNTGARGGGAGAKKPGGPGMLNRLNNWAGTPLGGAVVSTGLMMGVPMVANTLFGGNDSQG